MTSADMTTARSDRPTTRPGSPILVAAFVVLVILVGANIVAIRFSNRALAPFWNAGLRFALATVAFAAIGVTRGSSRPNRRALRDGIAYGLLAFAAFFGFVYLGLVRVPAGLGQVILALGPLITFAMAVTLGLERFRWRPIAGGLVAIVGIAVMYGVDPAVNVPLPSLLSLALAATSFAAGAILVKRAAPADPIIRNTIATAVGAVALLAVSVLAGETWLVPRDPATALAIAYLVLPGTVGVFLLFLLLLRHWSATAVSTQFVLAPIVGITLGALLLAEPVNPPIIGGAALVIGGVWLGAIRQAD